MKRTSIAILAIAGLILSGFAIAQAQQAQTERKVVDSVTGKIVEAGPDMIVLRTDAGKTQFVMNNGTERPPTRMLKPGTEVTVWYTQETQVVTEVQFPDSPPVEEEGEDGWEVDESAETSPASEEQPVEESDAADESPADDGDQQAAAEEDLGTQQDEGVQQDDGETEALPATASSNPLLRMLGLLALAGAVGLRFVIRAV